MYLKIDSNRILADRDKDKIDDEMPCEYSYQGVVTSGIVSQFIPIVKPSVIIVNLSVLDVVPKALVHKFESKFTGEYFEISGIQY